MNTWNRGLDRLGKNGKGFKDPEVRALPVLGEGSPVGRRMDAWDASWFRAWRGMAGMVSLSCDPGNARRVGFD
jgi:hypothetical protein